MTTKPLAKTERRSHDRVELRGYATFAEGRSGTALPVGNLGYNGMLLAGVLPGGERPNGEISGTLTMLDVSVPARGHVVRATAAGLGVLFDHSNGDLLQVLRLVLDPARYGSSMVAMNKSYVADAYRGPEWLVFQGLGPTVLTARYRSPEHREIDEFALTIRPGGYHVIEYRDGVLTTGVMKEGAGGFKAAVFNPTDAEQRHAARRGAGVLLGMAGLDFGAKALPMLEVVTHFLK